MASSEGGDLVVDTTEAGGTTTEETVDSAETEAGIETGTEIETVIEDVEDLADGEDIAPRTQKEIGSDEESAKRTLRRKNPATTLRTKSQKKRLIRGRDLALLGKKSSRLARKSPESHLKAKKGPKRRRMIGGLNLAKRGIDRPPSVEVGRGGIGDAERGENLALSRIITARMGRVGAPPQAVITMTKR